ncbi:CHAT domain-containing protein [Cercophora newfieldiana]|uniref:CHAT domain-containing protein n=1 Tax=Cercophora newfieldiana TaxID=92897 RepID=A0AA40CTW1_9PEZI|nr:CHAT domain-containing protein [Cercophora newfieldiana]
MDALQLQIQRMALAAGIGDDDLPDVLVSCAVEGLRQYKLSGNMSHLNTAVNCARGSVRFRNSGDMSLQHRLYNLGGLLLLRHEGTGSMSDLIEAIAAARDSLDCTPEDGPDRAMSLDLLGSLFEKLYDMSGDVADLDEAIQKSRRAAEMMPQNHGGRCTCLGNLGTKLRKHFVRTGDDAFLEEAILVARQAVALLPLNPQGRSSCLNGFGISLLARFERHSQAADLEEAIVAIREALDSAPTGHPERVHCLNTLAILLGFQFERTKDAADLNEAIDVARQLVNSAPPDHPKRPTYLDNLGTKLCRRYEQTGQIADLNEGIGLTREAVESTEDGYPDRAIWLSNLGNMLFDRYERENRMADLDEAIRLARHAVSLTPGGHADRAAWLNNLGVKLEERYKRTRQIADLEEAIVVTRETVNLTQHGHNDRAPWLNNLGNKLEMRFDHSHQVGDLEEAIEVTREAVDLTPEGHSTRAGHLSNLASKVYSRYGLLDTMPDLEEAISLTRQALDCTPADHPSMTPRLFQLGDMLEQRFHQTHRGADMTEGASYFLQAWQCQTALPVYRIRAAARCVRVLASNPYTTNAAILVGKQVIDFLPAVNTKLLDRDDEQFVMSTFSGIAADLCALLLDANRPVDALEYLEKGRAVIIGKIVDARSDLSSLLKQCPDLAQRYEALSDQVSAQPARNAEADPFWMRAVERRRQVAAELDACILEIRQTPGHERFLLGQTVSEMQACAVRGVIVFVNVTSRSSDAILVSAGDIKALRLPRLLANDARTWLRKKWMGPGVGRGERAAKNREYLDYLAWLWDVCVKQVVDEAGNMVPDQKPLPRVWWVGTGLAASMPFHAAGTHSPGSLDNAYSRVISSYSPSIKALDHSQRREMAAAATAAATDAADDKLHGLMLVITMPSTPQGANQKKPANLRGVEEEKTQVTTIANGRMDVQHLNLPSVDDVVDKLPRCSIAHFACHGTNDRADPSNSGLILQKKPIGKDEAEQDRLTVRRISELSLAGAQIAYLSACSTAENESGGWLSDEVIHVVSGFQVAGFPHVVGCLWSSVDHACVSVASEFYRLLLSGGDAAKWSGVEVAGAVQAAVLALREEYRDMPLFWAHGCCRDLNRSDIQAALGLDPMLWSSWAQWRHISSPAPPSADITAHGLSIKRLQEDLATCSKLRKKPEDPIGPGRDRNARYIDGHAPTLIKNATLWIGEPVEGTSAEDARKGKGYQWIISDVYLEYGLIQRVEASIAASSVAKNAIVFDAQGRQLTAGIIDMHSHAGVGSLPSLVGNEDSNEGASDITPYIRSIDGIQVDDHQIQVIKSGGVTTSLILPGSANNMGGEAYVIKHAVGKPDGRNATGAADLLADPDRNWRFMKMACGENAKRVYGKWGEHGPTSRMGESWEFRHAFEQAAQVVRDQDDWCDNAAAVGVENVKGYLPQEIRWESLGALLRDQVRLNTHCYTVPDLEAFIDHTNEFKFKIRAFHHAHQTYLVPDILKRAYGGVPPASAIFADNMYYKAEAYVGSEYAGKYLYDNGLETIYVSDNPVINAQHVVFEAARGYRYGLPYHVALAAVTTAPAERLGFGKRLGKVKPGFDADIVVWDSDPLSVGAAPVQVWIDGTAQFESPVVLKKPADEPIVPDENLSQIVEEPTLMDDVVFTGVSNILADISPAGAPGRVLISTGRITCVGACDAELEAMKAAAKSKFPIVNLRNGYLSGSFTGFGGTIGLNAIDMEVGTDNGDDGDTFSRAEDGLQLDDRKLHVAYRYGVTKAISAPKYGGEATHHGTSAGFLTGSTTVLDNGTVFASDVAVHYTFAHAGRGDGTVSASIGTLRRKLFEAAALKEAPANAYSESAFLQKVVNGSLPLAVTAHSADIIASVLKVKAAVDASTKSPIRLVIVGGAESWLVADQLAAADVSVILAPLLSYRVTWEERRALTGAPLTNGTAIDKLLDAGVEVAIGLEGDSQTRNLALAAGIAYKNGEGRLSEKRALNLVSANLYKIFGIKEPGVREGHFVIHEGNPLEIGSRVKAVAGGKGQVSVF